MKAPPGVTGLFEAHHASLCVTLQEVSRTEQDLAKQELAVAMLHVVEGKEGADAIGTTLLKGPSSWPARM